MRIDSNAVDGNDAARRHGLRPWSMFIVKMLGDIPLLKCSKAVYAAPSVRSRRRQNSDLPLCPGQTTSLIANTLFSFRQECS